jgi:hypothetical protein
MGQANVWYADSSEVHLVFCSDVLSYLTTRRLPQPLPETNGGSPRQPDPLLRQKIEQATIVETAAYYTYFDYTVDSVEADNIGWDLEAVHATRHLSLKLEVKGRSAFDCKIELTPNEYSKLKQHSESYRICVVTQALSKRDLAILAYSQESQRWEDQ